MSMKLFNLREQQKGDKGIDTENFNRMVRTLRALQNFQADPRYFDIRIDKSGVYLTLQPGIFFPWHLVAFGYRRAGAEFTVYPGTVRLHGIGISEVAETTVTLSGNPEWVFVQSTRATPPTASIQHSSTEPESTADLLRVPLYYLEASSGAYAMKRICHIGDINFDTPIRGY